mgnify:CR=1 FL=1|tara:strand:+ start:688 stop:1281 length:594 start_codon:yes stop_codon:yes gene_type:complete
MRIGVMCSGKGTNFENIVRTCNKDEVVVMIHNKEKCGAAKRAEKFGIPHTYIKAKNEDLIIDVFRAWKVDLIVMAGWMRIVTNKLIDAFPDKIINIHPSLLPKYKGLNAIERAFEAGDPYTGVSVHYVTEELDSGGIIVQGKVKILPDDTIETLTRKIHLKEYALLPVAIDHVKHQIQTKSHGHLLSHSISGTSDLR